MGKTFKRSRSSKNRRYKTRGKRLYGGIIRKRRTKNLFSKRVKTNYLSKKRKKRKLKRRKSRKTKKMYGGTGGKWNARFQELKDNLGGWVNGPSEGKQMSASPPLDRVYMDTSNYEKLSNISSISLEKQEKINQRTMVEFKDSKKTTPVKDLDKMPYSEIRELIKDPNPGSTIKLRDGTIIRAVDPTAPAPAPAPASSSSYQSFADIAPLSTPSFWESGPGRKRSLELSKAEREF